MTPARPLPWPKPVLHGQHLCALCLGWTAWTQTTGPRTGRHVFHCAADKLAAKGFADMSDSERKKMRAEGVYNASAKIGAYLDRINKSDFAQMSEREWFDFIHKVLDEYEVAIRDITKRFH